MSIRLEIVTPERLVYADDVDAVAVPGVEGELGVLPHHAPLITTLGLGELRIRKGGQEEHFAIIGGFLQVRPDKVVVMAETADLAVGDRPRAGPGGPSRGRAGTRDRLPRGADLAAARASLQQALLRIRVAERRHREGPRHRG